jgi:hypothetical protein
VGDDDAPVCLDGGYLAQPAGHVLVREAMEAARLPGQSLGHELYAERLAVGADRAFGICSQVCGVYYGRIFPILYGEPERPVLLFVAGLLQGEVRPEPGPFVRNYLVQLLIPDA